MIEREEAMRLIQAERDRQVNDLGYSPLHDDRYAEEELLKAANAYFSAMDEKSPCPNYFPFHSRHWKPRDRGRNLVKSGALLMAEIDRLKRREDQRDAGRINMVESLLKACIACLPVAMESTGNKPADGKPT